MFVALYRWKLKPGTEDQFRKSEDGTWVAYAQWPTKELWQAERSLGPAVESARLKMREAVEESLPSLSLMVSDDFLVQERP